MDDKDEFRKRVAAFRRLRIDEIAALKLAEAHVSPSYVRELIEKKGCTPEQAVRVCL